MTQPLDSLTNKLGKIIATARQFDEFKAALRDYLAPQWFMMKAANPEHRKAQAVASIFKDNGDDVKDIFNAYLKSDGAVSDDFDLHIGLIVNSAAWQLEAKKRIAECGAFAGQMHLLLGA